MPENPASYRVVRTKSYLFNKAVHSGGTPKNLSHLPLLFQSARERIDVVSCGKMGGIPQMTLKEWLKNT
ncbi:hypothetical protein CXO04_22910 [Salmonella enterica subsp. enterica serovar Senftenberg]|nr:hypothetical protein [Salmonella enterica subsp. enterica serovar Senftenberg]PQK25993.1 hypothetical protein C5Y85_23665 [Escherichia coli]RLY16374.1 hypothetical protein EAI40_21885 [Escherichia coli]RZY15028.1 hypothetical protein EXX42_22780 [Escherichia coli]